MACAVVLAIALLSLPFSKAQEGGNGRAQLLIIKTRDNAFYNPAAIGFSKGLKARGFKPGDRVDLKIVTLKGNDDLDSQAIKDLLKKRPQLIVTLGTDATRLVSDLKPTSPVLFSMVLDPVNLGVAKSLEVPGGNFTGTTLLLSPGKQFDALRQTVPKVHRIGVLHTENDETSLALLADAREEAKRLNLEIVAIPMKKDRSARVAWESLKEIPEALWVIPDVASTGPQALADTLEYARAHRLPVLGASGATVRAGALLALSANLEDLGDMTAEMATFLLSGTETVGKMRIRGPRRVQLSVNLVAARAIDLKIPDAVLRLADEVIDTQKEESDP